MQAKLIAASPLLEMFGNASTLKNDNSSRFGKLMSIQLGGDAAGERQLEAAWTQRYTIH